MPTTLSSVVPCGKDGREPSGFQTEIRNKDDSNLCYKFHLFLNKYNNLREKKNSRLFLSFVFLLAATPVESVGFQNVCECLYNIHVLL